MAYDISPTSIATSAATADTSADLICAARNTRQTVSIRNLESGADAYIGAAGVATATGYLLKQGEILNLDTKAAIYAITASGTASFDILETYW